MIVGLAYRGYLQPAGQIQVLVGPGPTIIDSAVAVPGVGGASLQVAEAPGITGSVVSGPVISKAGGQKASAGQTPPVISGSIKPKIG